MAIQALSAGAVEVARLPVTTKAKPYPANQQRLETPHPPFKSPSTSWATTAFACEPGIGERRRRWQLLATPGSMPMPSTAHLRSDASIRSHARPLMLTLAGTPADRPRRGRQRGRRSVMDRLLPAHGSRAAQYYAARALIPITDWHGKLTARAESYSLAGDLGSPKSDGWPPNAQGGVQAGWVAGGQNRAVDWR